MTLIITERAGTTFKHINGILFNIGYDLEYFVRCVNIQKCEISRQRELDPLPEEVGMGTQELGI